MESTARKIDDAALPANNDSEKRLLDHHQRELEASGLTAATIRASGCYSVEDGDEIRRQLNRTGVFEGRGPALVFPYPNADGFLQMKLDQPRVRGDAQPGRRQQDPMSGHGAEMEEVLGRMMYDGWDVGEPGEPIRYETPLFSSLRVYVPVHIQPEILDHDEPLWITEGVKKALAGCQSGLPMVAVAGVTCFHDAGAHRYAKAEGRNEKRLHPDLSRLISSGRKVILCFDSDVETKPQVLRALIEAAKVLQAAGAEVHITYIDQPGSTKLGVDDLLASLPAHVRAAPRPLDMLEESVRPFNVEDVIDWIAEQDFGRKQKEREVRRAVHLAAALFQKKADLERWIGSAAKVLGIYKKDLRSFVPEPPPLDAEAGGVRGWLTEWVKANHVTYSCATESMFLNGVVKPLNVVFSKLVLDSNEFESAPSETLLEHAITEWMDQQKDAAIQEHRARVTYDSDSDDGELRRWVRAVTGAEDRLVVTVFKHFIWQVKRKLSDLKVEHHLMPILHGRTGGGKSEAVKKLIAPVRDISDLPQDLSFLNDERSGFRLTRRYVFFFDEMVKADKVDVNALKQKITCDTVSWRILGKNSEACGPNRATFIGAANDHVKDIINDPLSVRRFFEVCCLDKLDWATINSIDYQRVWRCVDETASTPILEVLEDLRAHQEGIRATDAVEEWMSSRCEVGTGWTRACALYEDFVAWNDRQRSRYVASERRFGDRMKDLLQRMVGPEGEGWKKSNGKHYRVRLLPHDVRDGESRELLERALAEVKPN